MNCLILFSKDLIVNSKATPRPEHYFHIFFSNQRHFLFKIIRRKMENGFYGYDFGFDLEVFCKDPRAKIGLSITRK